MEFVKEGIADNVAAEYVDVERVEVEIDKEGVEDINQ